MRVDTKVPSFRKLTRPQSTESKYQQKTDVNAIGIELAFIYSIHMSSACTKILFEIVRCDAARRSPAEHHRQVCICDEPLRFGCASVSQPLGTMPLRLSGSGSGKRRVAAKRTPFLVRSAVLTGTRSKRRFSLAENWNDTSRVCIIFTFRSV